MKLRYNCGSMHMTFLSPAHLIMNHGTAFLASATTRAQRYFHGSRILNCPSLSLRHFAPKTKRAPRAKVMFEPDGPPPQKVAVIGGGLAGLAITYHLLHSTTRRLRRRGLDPESLQVTIFDPALPGEGGASAAAAGLLHCFTPRVKKKVWKPIRSMDAAVRLLKVAQEKTPETPLYKQSGLLRLASDERTENDFRIAANRFPSELEFLTAEQVDERFPNAPQNVSGIFIKKAVVVDTEPYLRNLWAICNDTGRATWRQQEINNLRDLLKPEGEQGGVNEDERFDTIVLCAGASLIAFPELQDIPITPCRGQNIHLESINEKAQTVVPLISKKYIIPDYFHSEQASSAQPEASKKVRMLAGATFEYQATDETQSNFLREGNRQDREVALTQLTKPLRKLMPNILDEWEVTGGSAGTRALPPRSKDGSIPVAGRLSSNRDDISIWALTCLGSRGILHHAYLARVLAHAIASGNETLVPKDARRFPISASLDGKPNTQD